MSASVHRRIPSSIDAAGIGSSLAAEAAGFAGRKATNQGGVPWLQ